MKKSHAKKALLTSVLALVLCVGMLMGTTFAWFTDETIESNLALFEDLEITGVTAELFDRSLLEEIYADGPTI